MKMMIAVAAVTPLAFPAFAATLEVGANRAFRTIQSAADVAQPGDVVLIDPGVYREWVKPANAGTEAAPITYRAREKGKTVITGADVVTGWAKRADGLWEVKLPYDSFRGLNPFTDFISGNWYQPAKGVRNPRTMLFRGNEQMRFREKLDDFGALQPCPEFLVNVAGLTVGDKVVAGATAELTGTAKPGCQTKWGLELGFVTPGSTAVYTGFPKTGAFTLHYSSAFEGRIEFRDGTAKGPALGAVELPNTGGWKRYADVPVALDRAPETGRLALVFNHRAAYGKRPYVGSYLLQPGMAAGKIVADFKDDPNDGKTELIVRPCCFYPILEGRDYLRLEGLVLRDAGPNWAGPHSEQLALVGTNWSRGWTIEDCEILNSPCAGVSLGKYGDEFDNYSDNSQRYTEAIERAIRHGVDRVGHHTVRRCRIRSCDQAGICGSLGAMFSTIEDCDIGYCHWNVNFSGCENACIKIHAAVDVLIRNNDLHHAGRLGAIWLDWMAQGTRVTGNRIHDIAISPATAWNAGIFIEVSHGPVIIDNNVILANPSVSAPGSQSIACVGNVLSGKFISVGDERRTPIWEPHSAKLREMLNDCGGGDHRCYNNVMAYAPPMNEKYPNFAADNAVVPPENWTVTLDGRYLLKNIPQVDFKPVDTARLGKNVLGHQAFENRDGSPYAWDAGKSPAVKIAGQFVLEPSSVPMFNGREASNP